MCVVMMSSSGRAVKKRARSKAMLEGKHLTTLGEEVDEERHGGPLVGEAQRRVKRTLKRKALGRKPRNEEDGGRDRSDEEDDEENGDDGEDGMDVKTSARILRQAREQQETVEREEREERDGSGGGVATRGGGLGGAGQLVTKAMEKERAEREAEEEEEAREMQRDYAEDDDQDDQDDEDSREFAYGGNDGDPKYMRRGSDDAYGADYGAGAVTEEEEKALAAFFTAQPGEHRSLSDIILAKLEEHTSASASASASMMKGGGDANADERYGGGRDMSAFGLDPKVEEVYSNVAKLLSRYKSGKLPKAVKIIPMLNNWEEVLFLTQPESWTPGATYEATRLFASQLSAKMAQKYYALVLLPRIRDDIAEHRRLHFNLYQALKKAAFKPAAFFKGILLPLCSSGNCTLREAVIISSVISRVSVPMLHSSAALLRIAEMEYSGINSFFIKVFLDKKYALPYKVVDALVEHFVRFTTDERVLPVIWHQSLLAFVTRYKFDIRAADKTRILQLLRAQFHYLVSPEVRREVLNSSSRGEIREALPGGQAGAVVVGGGGERQKAFEENITDMPEVLMREEEEESDNDDDGDDDDAMNT